METLLSKRKFKEIRETLNSTLSAEQFMAVYVLERLNEKGELELTESELKRIEEIKKSDKKVPICSGCTYWDEQPLSYLLGPDSDVISVHAGYWFERHYKNEK